MSGIEVAGLVLGAVPILIEAIEGYRRGLSKLKSGFKKRKVIEKLGRALRFQKSIIESITRNILAQSGCDTAVGANDTQLRSLLQNKQTQEMVDEFLGTHNTQVFSDALIDCMTDVSQATIHLASLVPSLALVKNNADVQAILNANVAPEKGRIQLFARLSVVFRLEDLKDEIEAIDRSTNLLDKFTRNVTANPQYGQNIPSRKAIKLAKALQVVRHHAVDLHSALTRQWVTRCHQRHELKIFLEDRITELMPNQAADDTRSSCFKVVFASSTAQSVDFWHETLFHIEAEDAQEAGISLALQGPRIRFSTPQQQPANPRLDVPDICATITGTGCMPYQPIFYLTGTRDINVSFPKLASTITQSSQSSSTALQKIFQDRHNQTSPTSPLPWKWRMALALKIASSFLQFAQTPWMQPSWSASNIHIPYTTGSHELDLSHPFLSADFSRDLSPPANRHAQVKDDLLELGILLLEIWHENNFETQFAQQLATGNVPLMRRACALEWLEDLENPLSEAYSRAVSHCVSGVLTYGSRAWGWDHLDLWKCVCENVIDPILQVTRV